MIDHVSIAVSDLARAVPFYEHFGARQIGEEPSGSIPGRVLPLLELSL